MPRDSGGWRSEGKGRVYGVRCPKCHEDRASMIETTIYGKTRNSYFCNMCAHDWSESERDDEGDSDR